MVVIKPPERENRHSSSVITVSVWLSEAEQGRSHCCLLLPLSPKLHDDGQRHHDMEKQKVSSK
jgi:hypothetical protein